MTRDETEEKCELARESPPLQGPALQPDPASAPRQQRKQPTIASSRWMASRGFNLAASFLLSIGIAAYLSIATDSVVSLHLLNSAAALGSEAHSEVLQPPASVTTQSSGGVKGGKEALTTLEERLEKGLGVIKRAMRGIEERHGEERWELLYKSVHNMNETRVVDKLKVAVLTGAPFIIGVQGTSVTAGHDNYFNQSFPVVMESLMKAGFKAAGLNLTIRNHAMGWNPVFPSHFCVAEIQGEDVDVATWEFGMMMGGETHYFEFFLRNALSLPKQPLVMILDPGEPSRDPNRNQDVGPWSNYLRPLLDHYDHFGLIMQGMYESIWHLEYKDEHYNYDYLYTKDKVTDHPAGWHPGPHGHRLRAEILGYFFLHMLHKAVTDVLPMLAATRAEAEAKAALHDFIDDHEDRSRRLPLPPPVFCRADLCQHPNHCVTTFEPRVGPSLLDHVIDPPPATIPNLDWTVEPDRSQAKDNSLGKWHTQLYACDVDAVTHSIVDKGFGYLDRKYILQGKGSECGPLKLAVTTTQPGPIILCSPPGNEVFQIKSTLHIDGQRVLLMTAEETDPLFDANPCYVTDKSIEPGEHVIEYRPDPRSDDIFPISHLIWY